MRFVSDKPESEVWAQIAPMLETALAQLGTKDHDAVVLRFFEGKTLKQVGVELGVDEDAARMRINRAGKAEEVFQTARRVIAHHSYRGCDLRPCCSISACLIGGRSRWRSRKRLCSGRFHVTPH